MASRSSPSHTVRGQRRGRRCRAAVSFAAAAAASAAACWPLGLDLGAALGAVHQLVELAGQRGAPGEHAFQRGGVLAAEPADGVEPIVDLLQPLGI